MISRYNIKSFLYLSVFLGIIGIAFVLRLFSWWMDSAVSRDGILYVNMAETWHGGGNYEIMLEQVPDSEWVPFLMIWLMKLLMTTGISAEAAGMGMSLVLGSLLPLIVYGIATVVCEKKEIALGAALLTAVHPPLIELSIEIQRDTPYLFFAGIVIWSLLGAIKYRKWYLWGLGGIAGALAVMIRYETFELLLLAFGYLFVAPLLKWETWRRVFGLYLPCFIFLFSLTVFSVYWLAGVSPREHAAEYYLQLNKHSDRLKKNIFSND